MNGGVEKSFSPRGRSITNAHLEEVVGELKTLPVDVKSGSC